MKEVYWPASFEKFSSIRAAKFPITFHGGVEYRCSGLR